LLVKPFRIESGEGWKDLGGFGCGLKLRMFSKEHTTQAERLSGAGRTWFAPLKVLVGVIVCKSPGLKAFSLRVFSGG
jgi:hypothetical protein